MPKDEGQISEAEREIVILEGWMSQPAEMVAYSEARPVLERAIQARLREIARGDDGDL